MKDMGDRSLWSEVIYWGATTGIVWPWRFFFEKCTDKATATAMTPIMPTKAATRTARIGPGGGFWNKRLRE
jgi:hypothetical protein